MHNQLAPQSSSPGSDCLFSGSGPDSVVLPGGMSVCDVAGHGEAGLVEDVDDDDDDEVVSALRKTRAFLLSIRGWDEAADVALVLFASGSHVMSYES